MSLVTFISGRTCFNSSENLYFRILNDENNYKRHKNNSYNMCNWEKRERQAPRERNELLLRIKYILHNRARELVQLVGDMIVLAAGV